MDLSGSNLSTRLALRQSLDRRRDCLDKVLPDEKIQIDSPPSGSITTPPPGRVGAGSREHLPHPRAGAHHRTSQAGRRAQPRGRAGVVPPAARRVKSECPKSTSSLIWLAPAVMKLVGGLPTTVATKRFAGALSITSGIPHLLEPAAVEHGDPVGHRHGLDLVVRNVDQRRALLLLTVFSSTRISRRSSASRFASGSSISVAHGRRT